MLDVGAQELAVDDEEVSELTGPHADCEAMLLLSDAPAAAATREPSTTPTMPSAASHISQASPTRVDAPEMPQKHSILRQQRLPRLAALSAAAASPAPSRFHVDPSSSAQPHDGSEDSLSRPSRPDNTAGCQDEPTALPSSTPTAACKESEDTQRKEDSDDSDSDITATYVECKHGWVLARGIHDESMRPLCRRNRCHEDAIEWFEKHTPHVQAMERGAPVLFVSQHS